VTTSEPAHVDGPALTSRGYRITLDEGRESFYAIALEEPDSEDAWIMSDTVRSLDAMR
jgi:hypothetical protein